MVMTSAEMMDAMDSMLNTLMMILILIAAISLLVGGIGIMNIMLVSVTERTREIGIRKSLGAKCRDIRSQFIIEAGTTSAIGGAIGILLGILMANVLTNVIALVLGTGNDGFVAMPTAGGIGVAFGVSVAVGILFGYLPANKAAKLNPIDAPALRLIPADEKRPGDRSLFCAENFSENCSPSNFFRSRRVYTAERTERTMRNVSHILEKQLTDYLVTDQARFYRLAYSYLKNREEALDAVQTAVCRALEKQGGAEGAGGPPCVVLSHSGSRVHGRASQPKAGDADPPEALDAGSYEDPLPSGRHASPTGGRSAARGGDHHQAAVL